MVGVGGPGAAILYPLLAVLSLSCVSFFIHSSTDCNQIRDRITDSQYINSS